MENIRHCHVTWVGGYCFYFFPMLAFFSSWAKAGTIILFYFLIYVFFNKKKKGRVGGYN
jgi:hypothetical protein